MGDDYAPDDEPAHMHTERARLMTPEDAEKIKDWLFSSQSVPIKSRKLTQATARLWDIVHKQRPDGEWEQGYCYRDSAKQVIAIKVRKLGTDGTGKDFYWIGAKDQVSLYGKNLWSKGGKMVVITEGELDAPSLSQVQDHQWPVVSVPNGAQSAAKYVAKELEWLNSFERVILMFDNDGPGQKAAEECARILPPGKAYIAKLPLKDASDMLVAGKGQELRMAVHKADLFRPDGIVTAASLISDVLVKPTIGTPYPINTLTRWTFGRKPPRLIVWGAGTGVGKSELLSQIFSHVISPEVNQPAAMFSWEAGPTTTFKSVLGKLAGKRFHIPYDEDDPDLAQNPPWTMDELRSTIEHYENKCAPLYINDHYGAVDFDSVAQRVRFLAKSEGVKHFLLDPVAALVAQEEDERKALDRIFASLAMLAQETESELHVVSHLTRPEYGPPHEEGGRVMLRHFRGSNAITMWADFVFGLERNQQADDPADRKVTTLRCLKDRLTGLHVGNTCALHYNELTGHLEEGYDSLDLTEED